jgi:adenylosuccinate synthase
VNLPPAAIDDFNQAVPVLDSMPGWQTDTTSCRHFEDLPEKARAYLERIEKETGAPVGAIGVGPDRNQTILR